MLVRKRSGPRREPGGTSTSMSPTFESTPLTIQNRWKGRFKTKRVHVDVHRKDQAFLKRIL